MLISELLNSFEQKETSEKYLRQMEEVERSCIVSQLAYTSGLMNQLVGIIAKQNKVISDLQNRIEMDRQDG